LTGVHVRLVRLAVHQQRVDRLATHRFEVHLVDRAIDAHLARAEDLYFVLRFVDRSDVFHQRCIRSQRETHFQLLVSRLPREMMCAERSACSLATRVATMAAISGCVSMPSSAFSSEKRSSTKRVSKLPAIKRACSRMRWWKGMLVITPTT